MPIPPEGWARLLCRGEAGNAQNFFLQSPALSRNCMVRFQLTKPGQPPQPVQHNPRGKGGVDRNLIVTLIYHFP